MPPVPRLAHPAKIQFATARVCAGSEYSAPAANSGRIGADSLEPPVFRLQSILPHRVHRAHLPWFRAGQPPAGRVARTSVSEELRNEAESRVSAGRGLARPGGAGEPGVGRPLRGVRYPVQCCEPDQCCMPTVHYRVCYRTVEEEQPCVGYREVYHTVDEPCRSVCYKPVYEQHTCEQHYTVCSRFTKIIEVRRNYTVCHPVYEQHVAQRRYTVCHPVTQEYCRSRALLHLPPGVRTARRPAPLHRLPSGGSGVPGAGQLLHLPARLRATRHARRYTVCHTMCQEYQVPPSTTRPAARCTKQHVAQPPLHRLPSGVSGIRSARSITPPASRCTSSTPARFRKPAVARSSEQRQYCYKTCTCEPVYEEKCVKVCTGCYETEQVFCPGPVQHKCCRLPGHCVFDPCTCTSHYCPGETVI